MKFDPTTEEQLAALAQTPVAAIAYALVLAWPRPLLFPELIAQAEALTGHHCAHLCLAIGALMDHRLMRIRPHDCHALTQHGAALARLAVSRFATIH